MKIIEIAQVKLNDGVTDDEYINELKIVQSILIEKLEGYIGRKTYKSMNGEWIDIVEWDSLENAEKASKDLMKFDGAIKWLQMIDPNSVKMLHLEEKIVF